MRLPFRSVEDIEWQKLAEMQNPLLPLPSASTIRRRLDEKEQGFMDTALTRLVPESKVALSLDCWSSSTRQSFLGIIVHYITKDWQLVEELIGFENLKDCHSGRNLAKVVNDLLHKFKLSGRITSITTDDASNNGTLLMEVNQYLEEALAKSFLDGNIQHIPCLSHVIQLGLKALLGKIRITPKNDVFIKKWKADEELSELAQIESIEGRGTPWILAKV